MQKPVRGVLQGKTIVLEEDLGLPDGQPVELHISIVPAKGSPQAGTDAHAGSTSGGMDEGNTCILVEVYPILRERERGSRPASGARE